mgnify:CR=1 FL=1
MAVHLSVDDSIATLRIAMPGRANTIDPAFVAALGQGLDEALAVPDLRGIVLASGHKDFCVGANLDLFSRPPDAAALGELVATVHDLLRRIETAPVPVVAALEGSALGGGYELALACHHRIALDDAAIQIGLPEVNLGLIPGAGGTQRLPRLLGVQAALELIAQAQVLRAPKARAKGLVDALAADSEALHRAAAEWIAAHPKARQPWDQEGFRWPGGHPDSEAVRTVFMAGAAMLYARTAGAFPAAEAVFSVVQEGARVRFERALQIESRAFCRLAISPQARAMVRTFFVHKSAADRHQGLPALREPQAPLRKAAVLGAGMMGGGLAFLLASRGVQVVLRDIRPEALDAAMARLREQVGKRLKHLPEAERQAVVERVHPTLDLQDLRGCELVIEAVVENEAVKQALIAEVEPLLAPDALFASNTSALPITRLARASRAPERFIGLHFFSPVEQMPLLEIIRGEATDERSVARGLALCRLLKKTPIVVRDGYGFYTTRVFSAYILEGAQLVAEGVDPRLVEWGARQAGMVVGPLQVFDEVSLSLGRHVLEDARREIGPAVDIEGAALVGRMVEQGRLGRAHGAGFYDYEGGKRRGMWSGLEPLRKPAEPVAQALACGERLLLAQCAEVARRLDAGVLERHRDADLGAVLGIGFAPNTGGPLSTMDILGLPAVVERLDQLAALHGERFSPAPILRTMAANGERFYP